MSILTGTIQKRHDTAANWAAANPVLLTAEEGYETDTGKEKIGDGSTAWNRLPYKQTSTQATGLVSGGSISVVSDDVTIAAASWYISGSGVYSTSVATDFLNIALSSTGTQRYIGFYGNTSNAIVKVEGDEGAVASYPDTPSDTAVIGYVLVTDGAVGSGEGPSSVNFSDIGGNASDNASLVAFVKNPRVYTVTSSANITLDIDLYDILYISGLATNTTITITGTLSSFRPIIVVAKDNGTARTLLFHSNNFFAAGESLPTTTTANKILTAAFLGYPSNSKLGCVGVKTEA